MNQEVFFKLCYNVLYIVQSHFLVRMIISKTTPLSGRKKSKLIILFKASLLHTTGSLCTAALYSAILKSEKAYFLQRFWNFFYVSPEIDPKKVDFVFSNCTIFFFFRSLYTFYDSFMYQRYIALSYLFDIALISLKCDIYGILIFMKCTTYVLLQK